MAPTQQPKPYTEAQIAEALKRTKQAGRTADYKALMYMKESIEKKPEYLAASDADKKKMLRERMAKGMATRRSKGQDEEGKVALIKSGDRNAIDAVLKLGTPKPQIRQLEEEGLLAPRDVVMAEAPGTPVPGLESLGRSMGGSSMIGGSMVGGRMDGGDVGARSMGDVDMDGVLTLNGGPSKTNANKFKASGTPAPFFNMTPEPFESVEGHDQAEVNAEMRNELLSLRNMIANMSGNGNNMRAQTEVQIPRIELGGGGSDNARVNLLEKRMMQVENVVNAIRESALPQINNRVIELEKLMEKLSNKIGQGAEAEVAKMREVFGTLKEALARHDDIL